jgi:TonB family protein
MKALAGSYVMSIIISIMFILLNMMPAYAAQGDSSDKAGAGIVKEAQNYYNQGFNNHKNGEKEKAIANYSKAIKLNPTFSEAYYFRGLLYADLGKDEEAVADFTKAFELNPGYYNASAHKKKLNAGVKVEGAQGNVLKISKEPEIPLISIGQEVVIKLGTVLDSKTVEPANEQVAASDLKAQEVVKEPEPTQASTKEQVAKEPGRGAILKKAPEFPGGKEALVKFLCDHLVYPSSAVRTRIEGSVHIRFIVDANGKINDVTVVKGIDKLCDQEAIRLVSSMPDWIPAEINGKKAAVRFTLPIRFSLSNNKPI